jgi:hypothetical protein
MAGSIACHSIACLSISAAIALALDSAMLEILYPLSCFRIICFQYLYTQDLFQEYQSFHCVVKQNSVTFNQTDHRFEFGNLINSFALS